jgi:proton-coupled amino acid transporter
VVKLKRYIERVTPTPTPPPPVDESDNASASDAASAATATTNITYPDVGDFMYGKQFQSYIALCVCVQQLAICTVFLSFIGENLLAVLERLNAASWLDSHTMVTTLALPAVLSLSFLPSLKSLSPVMAAGTVLMILGFVALGVVGGLEWADRPETPTMNPPQIPLAVCYVPSLQSWRVHFVSYTCIQIVSNSFYVCRNYT